ncbi:MAG: hypothetical protein ABIA75_07290 [Candidatus Neomarinimicrobiota bacterium]
MLTSLERIRIHPKSGNEKLHYDGESVDIDLLSFWIWSASDFISNTTRGILAEFIVAKGMGNISSGVRNEWEPYDLETDDGIKIEVKSAAYVQSWHQHKLSHISFRVQKKLVWEANTNRREGVAKRPADVYVFALLSHKDKMTIDPLNLKQWEFFVLPTEVLNQRKRSQHSITLKSLDRISGGSVNFFELKAAVIEAQLNNIKLVGQLS